MHSAQLIIKNINHIQYKVAHYLGFLHSKSIEINQLTCRIILCLCYRFGLTFKNRNMSLQLKVTLDVRQLTVPTIEAANSLYLYLVLIKSAALRNTLALQFETDNQMNETRIALLSYYLNRSSNGAFSQSSLAASAVSMANFTVLFIKTETINFY